jgi:hypothetical protein
MDFGLPRPTWESYLNPEAIAPTDFEYAFKQLETQFAYLLRITGNQGTVKVWRIEGLKPWRRVLFTDIKNRPKIAYLYNDPIDGWEIRRINVGWPV